MRWICGDKLRLGLTVVLFFSSVHCVSLAAVNVGDPEIDDDFIYDEEYKYGYEGNVNEEVSEDAGDFTAADGWFNEPNDRSRAKELAEQREREQREGEGDGRYFYIFTEGEYDYYMDTESAKWITRPYSEEYIVDVWVRLVPSVGSMASLDGEYSFPMKYYMEHYYLRPQTKQIQFLCELEVTGRPENNVPQRPYSMSNWEELVPDSIEDKVYQSVMANMKQAKHKSKPHSKWTDWVDENLRIAVY